MTRKRIPGGEKNQKSGIVWSREELGKVLDLYISLGGKGIHEHNPRIIALGEELGRTTRSVEGQLIMYRSIERGNSYGHNNMNSICSELWIERYSNRSNNNMGQQKELFPAAFKKWTSASSGGIRKPFDRGTGRPTGERILTNMAIRLIELFDDSRFPKLLFLVGGPGNGKTDTLEYFVEKMDERFSLGGRLSQLATNFYKNYPRKVKLDLSEFGDSLPFDKLWMVQDASERDSGDKDAASSLINDLNEILLKEFKGVYICCINRGVLDKVRRKVKSLGSEVCLKIIDAIHLAVSPILVNKLSSNNDNASIWPLNGIMEDKTIEENYGVYVWPMDLESLLCATNEGNIPFLDLVDKAIDISAWELPEGIQKFNPFRVNRESLSEPKVRESLVNYLRYFELLSGGRLTFRDLLSLIAHMLNVDPKKISKDNADWGSRQQDFAKAFKAIHSLYENLWHVRMFPWKLSQKSNKQILGIIKRLKDEDEWDNDGFSALNVAKLILDSRNGWHGGYIESVLEDVAFKELDPASCLSSLQVADGGIPFDKIDGYFSKGIRIGLGKVENLLTDIEVEYLKMLSDVEENSLEYSSVSKTRLTDLPYCLGFFRRYAAILVKRSIGLRNGVFNNSSEISLFLDAIQSNKSRDEVRLKLRTALFPDEHFKVSFTSSLAQPLESIKEDAYITVKLIPAGKLFKLARFLDKRHLPVWDHLGVVINNGGESINTYINLSNYISLLKLSGDGVLAGCIPPEVLLWKDQLLSTLASGQLWDFESLDGEHLHLGSKAKVLIKENGEFNFE